MPNPFLGFLITPKPSTRDFGKLSRAAHAEGSRRSEAPGLMLGSQRVDISFILI